MFRIPATITALIILFLTGTNCTSAQENTRIRDVVYGRKYGMALTMDVWKPAKQSGVGVMFVISGAFISDIIMVDSGFFGPAMFKPFLDRGHTLFLVCHGSQPKFTVSEIVPDMHRAVRFIRVHAKEYGVDPNRLGIMGTSSGGFLSLTIGATGKPGNGEAADPVEQASSRVQAVGCFCPPCDLVNYGETGRSVVQHEPVKFAWHVFGVQSLPKDEQLRVLRELSPIRSVTKEMPPTLIIHGDADETVPAEQSERLVAKMNENQVPHQLIIKKGAGHGWPDMADDYALLAEWFDKHLRPMVEKSK
jgi:acetyl esterase/lipase